MSRVPEVARGNSLLLVGAGHAHLAVLRSLAARPLDAVRPTLVVPTLAEPYSGMVPSVVAGRLPIERATMDLRPLAEQAGVRVVLDHVSELSPSRGLARTRAGSEIPWDLCSIDVGAKVRVPEGFASDPRVVPAKPLGELARRSSEFHVLASSGTVDPTAAVVGAGAAGIEIAFALRARLGKLPGARVFLLDRAEAPLSTGSPAGRRMVARELARAGVEVVAGRGAIELEGPEIRAGGSEVARPALVVLATGASAPDLLAHTGLALDREGFLPVDRWLRSTTDVRVSAAGDCASFAEGPALPRAGVHAVRQGPVLAANLRVAAGEAGRLRAFRPREAALSLLAIGDGRAIALRGRLASSGRAWGWLKDRIDSAYVDGQRAAAFAGV